LRLLLTDERFSGDVMGGSMLVEDALDEVLWTDPPLANMGLYFPVHDTNIGGTRLRAGDAVMISLAATNRDALLRSPHKQGNRAHLAFGAGPHACPGRSSARLIASVALEKLLDRIPDLALAGEVEQLKWLSGVFVRGVITLPVRFAPVIKPGSRRTMVPPGVRPGERDQPPHPDQRDGRQEAPQGASPLPSVPSLSLSLPAPPGSGGEFQPEGEDRQKQQSALLGFLTRWRRSR
ncbi:cytochrome P450, partial [Streptomyces milbemycinicus]